MVLSLELKLGKRPVRFSLVSLEEEPVSPELQTGLCWFPLGEWVCQVCARSRDSGHGGHVPRPVSTSPAEPLANGAFPSLTELREDNSQRTFGEEPAVPGAE